MDETIPFKYQLSSDEQKVVSYFSKSLIKLIFSHPEKYFICSPNELKILSKSNTKEGYRNGK